MTVPAHPKLRWLVDVCPCRLWARRTQVWSLGHKRDLCLMQNIRGFLACHTEILTCPHGGGLTGVHAASSSDSHSHWIRFHSCQTFNQVCASFRHSTRSKKNMFNLSDILSSCLIQTLEVLRVGRFLHVTLYLQHWCTPHESCLHQRTRGSFDRLWPHVDQKEELGENFLQTSRWQ